MGNRLAGKVIVITGSTKGIGKGMALLCAADGAKMVISGKENEEGQQVVRDIGQTYGVDALFVHEDLTREAACHRLIEEAVNRYGKIDGLVNNAGIYPRSALIDTTEELFDSVMDVNFKAAFFCSKYAIQSMLKTGGGSIVHMGSTHGYGGGANLAAYACSKGALRTLNQHIASSYSSMQIRSNWITVGWVASDGEVQLQERNGIGVEDMRRMAVGTIPSGRMQTYEDIGHGVIYLLCDEALQVTGTELAITGGLVNP